MLVILLRCDKFKSNARETWCVILVSVSWHILLRITAHPRGAFISVGDCTPTEKDLLLLTTCRSGSLLDWDKIIPISDFRAAWRLYFEKTIINKYWFCSVVLNAPFCPVKQKLCRNECKVSMVKIPQHKVTKFNKFFSGSFSCFLSNPIEYLQRLSIYNPANQLKDLGKKTENIKISGN